MIYLDNCATTKINKEVLDEMMPYLLEEYGNPEGRFYSLALNAKNAIDKARERVAKAINCRPNEVIFNSGASEGNNTVLKGVAEKYQYKGKHIITTEVEHSSVYETCKYLETKGFKVTYLKVDDKCQIDLKELENAINDETILVSVMWVNNEVGSIMPIEEISKICLRKKVLFHSDATQAFGKTKINLKEYKGLNFTTFSGHKVYGPKGIGALYIKRDQFDFRGDFVPLIHGGGQEQGRRSGTLPVQNIVGIGKAFEIQSNELEKNMENLQAIEKEIISSIKKKYKDEVVILDDIKKVFGILSVRFMNINNEILLKNISDRVAASTGSACSNLKPSRVLKAMGKDDKEISETIRISFSPYTIVSLDIF